MLASLHLLFFALRMFLNMGSQSHWVNTQEVYNASFYPKRIKQLKFHRFFAVSDVKFTFQNLLLV